MEDSSFYLSEMARGIIGEVSFPKTAEVALDPSLLREAAVRMARRGYEPNVSSLTALSAYIRGYNLWLAGDVGTGKTEFFRTAPWHIPDPGNSEHPSRVIVDMSTYFVGMDIDGISEFLAANRYNELVLDDVGNEGTLNQYGNRTEILPFILKRRASVSPCTHITTNHTKEEIDTRYGYGFFDRLRASAFYVKFSGISRRVLTPHIRHELKAIEQ